MALGGALGLVLVAGDAVALCVAGTALGDIYLRLAWQALHLVTSTFVLHGRRAAAALMALDGALGSVLVAGDAAAIWVAGVALGHIHLCLAWQAWHLWWHLWHWVARLGGFWSPVAPRHFAWQAWHLATSTFIFRVRCGTWSHPPSFCLAGVALMVLGGALGSVLVAGECR